MVQISEGASYFGLPNFSNAYQRSRRNLMPTTLAESGICSEGEMLLTASVISAVEKGCMTRMLLRRQSGEWGYSKVRASCPCDHRLSPFARAHGRYGDHNCYAHYIVYHCRLRSLPPSSASLPPSLLTPSTPPPSQARSPPNLILYTALTTMYPFLHPRL